MLPRSLPQAARDAADRGELIAAIEFTRHALGVDLAEAQRAVNAYLRGASTATPPTFGNPVPPQAVASIARGNLIEAIKHTRAATGLGLKEAKDAVERYIAENPHVKAQATTSSVGARSNANFAPVVATFVVGIALTALGYWLLAAH